MKASESEEDRVRKGRRENETVVSSGVQPLSKLSDVGSVEDRLVDFPFFFVLR